jgi:UDP-N-acetylmuramate--alanine ligase
VKLEKFKSVYFLGIGGIGMSALARYFLAQGYTVAGYDKTSTDLTRQLSSEGIDVHYEDDVNLIGEMLTNKEELLVVYTPAIPADHKELNFFRNNAYALYKRSQVLGMITEGSFTVAVAGTHGKTTTSSMVAHLLTSAGVNCTAFVGGITQNYKTNLLLADPDAGDQVVVVEADEYDRSFLTLHPDIAIITSADPDHLDIYGSGDAVTDSFNEFIKKIKPGGKLLVKEGLALDQYAANNVSYTFNLESGDYSARNIKIEDATFLFDIYGPEGRVVQDARIIVPGYHNVANALAASAVALSIGVAPEKIKEALLTFGGVKRRFEYIYKSAEVVYIDDYAHHPAEIEAFIRSAKAVYPEKRLTVIFQPHLYSRTRDFADGFAQSLSLADEIVMLPIYPARELPIEGVSSEMILERVQIEKKHISDKADILTLIESLRPELLVTMGAGDIDLLINPIKDLLENRR